MKAPPPPPLTVSGIAFTVAESERPDDPERWQRVGDHLAAWLLAEWEREQGGSAPPKQIGGPA